MYKRWQIALLVILLVVIVPGFVLQNLYIHNEPKESPPEETKGTILEPTESITMNSKERYVRVLCSDGKIIEQELEEYVCCVVLAEIPASFEDEAIKSQAIVARTYTLRRIEGNSKHDSADICTNSSCCQGYCSESDFLSVKGLASELSKVKKAVADTEGLVLLYEDELIEATYFSCSGGVTEAAAAVWGEDIPYLQSTLSPGEDSAKTFLKTTFYSAEELSECLNVELGDVPESWFGKPSYTTGLGVKEIRIGNRVFTGKEVRTLLNLRSTAFEITVFGNTVAVTTRGYGHRVGMSQYGAEAMAVSGCTYAEILTHYYKGIQIEKMDDYILD